jgi:cytochrome P450
MPDLNSEPGLATPAHVPPGLVRDTIFNEPNTLGDPYAPTEQVYSEFPPVFWYQGPLSLHKGIWVVTRYADILRVYQDGEAFSTNGLVPYQRLAGEQWPMVPLEIDPPEHLKYRVMLNPFFSPRAIDQQEGFIRRTAVELIENLRPRGACDFTNEFARIYPVRVFLNLMGLPFDRFDDFMHWVHLIHFSSYDAAKMAEGARLAIAYLKQFIAETRANPSDNLTSHIIAGRIDERPISDDEIIGTVFFLWIGGLDTVAATLSLMFRRLALQPELQSALRAAPAKLSNAVEEFLRVNPLVNSSRRAKRDVELHGVTIKAGDWVMCLNSSGNFDPDEFDRPREVDFDRQPNRHFSLAGGPHRCLGAHLARRELKVALEEWLARVPEFRLEPNASRLAYPGLKAVDALPITWRQTEAMGG